MNKNGKLLNIIFSSESKKKYDYNNLNKQELMKKLSSSKQKISEINFSDIGIKKSNFIDFKTFKNKKDKSNNNSKIKQNKKNFITSLNETNEKENNINDDIILKYQYYKYLSNTNEKDKTNLKKNYITGTKLINNNSNIKGNEFSNLYNPSNELEKKKTINKKYNKKIEEKIIKNENAYQKNNRFGNKIEKFLSNQIKNNVISKEDLLSLFNNNNSKKDKNIKNMNNYISTNPNNETDKKYINNIINNNNFKNKNYEKSCPKFNFNKYASYRQGQNNINLKNLNYHQINEEKNENNIFEKKNMSKTSMNEIKTIRGNIISNSNYSLIDKKNTKYSYSNKINFPKNKINLNLDNNRNNNIKLNKANDNNKNIIEFFLPNKLKQKSSNNKNDIGKIIGRNDDAENNNQKINTQTDINNNKIGVRKIRTLHEKNNIKDLTLNNMALKKRRPRYFDSEINSNIIDSTNILNKIKNKNTYFNLIRKAFNNINTNYYNNYMSNKENIKTKNNLNKNRYEQNLVRDSKSTNIIRNRSNNSINKDKNKYKDKIIYANEPYINKLISLIDNKDIKKSIRHYSSNQKNNEYLIRKNSFENDIVNNNEINDDKVIENISNNSLNTYSIFISHKYYKSVNKIALKKIKLFDINDNEIPVIFYRTNADFNNGRLFNTKMTNIELLNKDNNYRDEIINNNIPFITQIKKDIYIYFYLNNNKSDNIKYIQIENYYNKINKNISSVKNIEIYKSENLIYKGVLINNINTIEINNPKNNNNKGRPFSSSKTRKDTDITKSSSKQEFSTYTKEYKKPKEIYYTARNNLFNQFNENANIPEENDIDNDFNLLRNSEVINKKDNYNLDQKNNNNGNNTINIHINNNTNNITNLEFIEKNSRYEKKNGAYFFTMQNKDLNNIKDNNENDLNTSLNKNLEMSFGRINSDDDYKEKNDFEEKSFESGKKIAQKIQEINYDKNNNTNENNSNGNILINSINNSFQNLFSKNNYIQFNKIKFVITSNYGHKKHVGLTGIEFYNMKGDLINIESAISIGALPKDLRTIYDDERDVRIFENVFNGFNNTDEIENMWVTKLKKTEQKSFIELCFKEKLKVSKLKFYNYNEKNSLHIGVKTMDLYLDDNFYNTIYLKPGIGEIAYDYINLNDENLNNDRYNESEDDNDNKDNDFGQIITFPINNSDIEQQSEMNNNKFEIKYASFLYEQSYETPFMPCGNYIKFEFLSNYHKGISLKNEKLLFKYKDIGLDSIEIYNEKNVNIIKNKSANKFKIISNCEIFHNKRNKLILNGAQNKDANNCLFYIFDKPIKISYIKLNPLTKNLKSLLNSVKEIKIFCDSKIIFEGELYIEHPTLVLFTCDMKITKGINEKYLTQKINVRNVDEIENDQYCSLILN